MILVDPGPLVALFDPRDNGHPRVGQTLSGLAGDLITTVPALTEAMHLLERPAGRPFSPNVRFSTRPGDLVAVG